MLRITYCYISPLIVARVSPSLEKDSFRILYLCEKREKIRPSIRERNPRRINGGFRVFNRPGDFRISAR